MVGKSPQEVGREARKGGWSFFQKMVPILEMRIYQVGRFQDKIEGKSRLVLFCVWKNPSRSREGRTEGGWLFFRKMVPILETRILSSQKISMIKIEYTNRLFPSTTLRSEIPSRRRKRKRDNDNFYHLIGDTRNELKGKNQLVLTMWAHEMI